MAIRQPIVSVLGHVDAGKTTLLDHIRGTMVAEQEAGGITQMIGSTTIPLGKIEEVCGPLLNEIDTDLEIPGLLFIDTPGHAAFTSLRKRGGSLSDIAVLVIDINDGIQPQTREAIDILQESGTPFVVALNKIDTLPGWEEQDRCVVASYAEQPDRVQERLDDEIYDLMAEFADLDFTVDRYDRVDDFQQTVGVVPMSAEAVGDEGRGTVLEVNELKGFGTTIDIIVSDGTVHADDVLVVGTADGVITRDIKALLEPKPLTEMRADEEY
ncbi:MAG: GTP-binding protein, partial [Candidatus Nanohaloarchaea archaeon]